MELTIKRDVFEKGLNKVSEIVSVKPSINILSGILLESKENEVVLTATDLENTIRTSIECNVVKKGTGLIPGKKLISLIKQLRDENIKISSKDSQINIQTQNSTYNFLGMNYEEFPNLPKFSGEIIIKVQAKQFKTSIDKTKFCIYPEEPRPHFRGALLEIKNKNYFFVATDTKRLALVREDLKEVVSEDVKCLLPYKLLNSLSNLLEKGDIEISVGKNQVFFKFDNTFLTSQLLEGSNDFPDYNTVIPDEKNLKIAKIKKSNLQATLKRISLFTSERYNKIKLSFGKQRMVLSVISPEVGEAQEKLEIEYDGNEQDIAFNPEYLLEFLQKAEGETVSFGFTNETKPALLKADSDPGYFYIAMPLKLD